MFKVTIYRYNNTDFSSILFRETSEEAERVAERLRKLRHITKVEVNDETTQ